MTAFLKIAHSINLNIICIGNPVILVATHEHVTVTNKKSWMVTNTKAQLYYGRDREVGLTEADQVPARQDHLPVYVCLHTMVKKRTTYSERKRALDDWVSNPGAIWW